MRARPAAAGAGILIALAVLAYSSATRVPPGSIGVVPGREGTLPPGWHLHSPLGRVVVLPSGETRYTGVVTLETPEGATLEYPYRLALDWDRAATGRLEELASAVGAGRSVAGAVTEEVTSAVSAVLGSGESRIDAAVGEKLAGLGLIEGSLRIGPPRGADEDNPLRSAYGGPPHRLLVIGIDSADWDLMDPLMESGELPNLKALKDRGAWASLQSMVPTLSPLLWTTIATGKRPEDHGVVDFLMVDPVTGYEAPISRLFRKVKALWNITTDVGVPSLTVGWWATWPAERVLGDMVTDRVAYTLFDIPLGETTVGITYPDGLIDEVADLVVDESSIGYEDLRGLVNVSAADFERARGILVGPEGYRDPLAHLIKVMASTESYDRIARHLIERDRPDVALVYFEGLDEVNHRFAHYLPPAMSLVEEKDPSLIEAYGGAVPGFYRFQDRIVGELVRSAGPDTVVMILSDHGFANGSERPLDMAPNIEGKPGLWHTLDGVFIVAGPSIRPGPVEEIGLLDVAPTILAILGLPPAQDMPGRVVSEIFRDGPPEAPGVEVASYDAIGEPIQNVAETIASGADPEMIAKLRALGYLQAGGVEGGGATTPTYHINSGRLFLERDDLDRAEQEFNRARELAPAFDQALLGLAEVRILRGHPEEAIPFLEKVLKEKPDPQPSLMIRSARVYAQAGMERQGIETLGALSYTGRLEAFRLAALGALLEKTGDVPGARADYSKSVSLDPGVVRSLEGLYRLMTEGGELEELGTILEKSLDVPSQAARVRVANWLALTRERQGREEEARAILSKSLEDSPDEAITLTNLGSMLVREDHANEGLPLLERALAQRPGSIEIVVNLIVAQGKLSNLPEARRYFEMGESFAKDDEMKLLYNAIGFACFLNGAVDDAADFIERSLAIDPDQENARKLRDEIAKIRGSRR